MTTSSTASAPAWTCSCAGAGRPAARRSTRGTATRTTTRSDAAIWCGHAEYRGDRDDQHVVRSLVATTTASVASISYGDGAPSLTEQVPGSDLELAMVELGSAMRGYRVAEEYYEGTRAEVFASVRLRRAMAKTGTSFRF